MGNEHRPRDNQRNSVNRSNPDRRNSATPNRKGAGSSNVRHNNASSGRKPSNRAKEARRRARRRAVIRNRCILLGIILIIIIVSVVSCRSHKSKKANKDNKSKAQIAALVDKNIDTGKISAQIESAKEEETSFTDQEMAQLTEDAKNGILILVNKENGVPENYVPADLADIKYFAADRLAEARFMRTEAADAFHQMIEAAKAEGHEVVMTTAYRSYSFQAQLYNGYVAKYGQESADKRSAKPGYSEHQTGLAVDVACASVGYKLTNDFGNTPEGQWMGQHCSEYGFILRYTEANESITGYMPEAWHFRYVGKTAAKYMTEKNITLEEFLQEFNLIHTYEELYAGN